MSANNMSFDDVQREVKELEKEVNSKLVSLLNSCDEPVICPVITTSSHSFKWFDKQLSKEQPVFFNILQRNGLDMCAELVYSENSSTSTIS